MTYLDFVFANVCTIVIYSLMDTVSMMWGGHSEGKRRNATCEWRQENEKGETEREERQRGGREEKIERAGERGEGCERGNGPCACFFCDKHLNIWQEKYFSRFDRCIG